MFDAQESFSEDIYNLEISGDMGKGNELVMKCFSDVVTINFNMLGSLMKDRISYNLDCTVVVACRGVACCGTKFSK